ncbi:MULTISPECIES: tRNA (adenosine(37)-N6)-threonylcarbamoyltransferase complex ATPase subunit type 1 TsaE [Polynucleobacter]|jgi:tRNA threonylcarbamoyladenosine biosynthesis protein TsaE|uniref:tRNA (adenosine(37)-N6)-threonylcarbamoyltransferase complex ATPase subunit type 1 TsaE n=1 Tax=Polynucleobacter TaxID=44013 RepID=UPI001BFE3653|nr:MULTISPECIES: tRNA (adenosine(37)-N6)-threonylcarbamoyltransferase complex ATPase subunit type 1 TsaE [Polynucleobacter]MBU3598459.1 tRNA (adenosine(37)-N6)-threonylcarbamoyltransferase complex ATPase subunit type 1 TsaE [Polynucleobacter bastaniensis]QWE31240.1 tRNA (adenosine(37)-N6)-threonylcarbamoyltransferase complex ATPase subunit type 1 TsaE [Polynucleobacter sp. Adler-ghost]
MAQNSFTHHCRQEADTATLAQKLASSLDHLFQADPSVHLNISLEGDLGAGKTTFARHLIQGLGYEGRVKSPTYTLCEPYPLIIHGKTLAMNHFDLYRMRDPLEWQEAGFAEHFDEPGFCLVEWPEKAEGTLPTFDVEIHLIAGTDENERNITFQANSNQGMIIFEKMCI